MTQLNLDDYFLSETELLKNITDGFTENINETVRWLNSPKAKRFFNQRQGLINEFFETSGINNEWHNICHKRARLGVDVTSEIYEYARKKNMREYTPNYTTTEREALNLLCDYNYNLIVNVTSQQVQGIRYALLEDVASGVNPLQTNIKEHLNEIMLDPINGWSPLKRAEVIARTESARVLNTSTLETYRPEGVQYVELIGLDDSETCDDCSDYRDKPVPIDEALNIGVIHPNCRCAWVEYTGTVNQSEVKQ